MKLSDNIKTSYVETIDAQLEDLSVENPSKKKIKTVIKRGGTEQKYSSKKIKKAIIEAYKSVGQEIPDNLFRRFSYYLGKFEDRVEGEKIKVEDIQDVVEFFLMKENPEVAKQYIIYREARKNIRKFVNKKRKWIETYKGSSNTANATIDDNSNVGGKNIGILNSEIHKEDNIQISRGMVMSKLKEMYPDFDPKSYIRDLESHIIYKHDESSFAGAIAPYCCSISMMPFLNNGLKELGGLSAAPKNLDSYCGLYINLIFAVAAQFAGAVATSEFLLYFDYFAKKDYGDDYWKYNEEFTQIGHELRRLEKWINYDRPIKSVRDIESIVKEGEEGTRAYSDDAVKLARELLESYKDGKIRDNSRTIKSVIHQKFQQVIYSINQPAAARGMQSAFVNFSYFDKPFFEGMFGNFVFPDFTKPTWESLNWLQRDFMMWFNEERLKTVITFPVESFALVYKNGKFVDEDSAKFVAEEYTRGHSFFTYISDTVDSLSSCCFEGDEVIKIQTQNEKGDTEYSYLTIEDFVNSQNNEILNEGTENLKYNAYIEGYNTNGDIKENILINGVLKKKYTGDMYELNVDNNIINITEDHLVLVKDTKDNIIKQIEISEIYKDPERYLVAIDT